MAVPRLLVTQDSWSQIIASCSKAEARLEENSVLSGPHCFTNFRRAGRLHPGHAARLLSVALPAAGSLEQENTFSSTFFLAGAAVQGWAGPGSRVGKVAPLSPESAEQPSRKGGWGVRGSVSFQRLSCFAPLPVVASETGLWFGKWSQKPWEGVGRLTGKGPGHEKVHRCCGYRRSAADQLHWGHGASGLPQPREDQGAVLTGSLFLQA